MQRALVTGASRGIGPALVAELAGRGLEVIATARRVDDPRWPADRARLDDTAWAARVGGFA